MQNISRALEGKLLNSHSSHFHPGGDLDFSPFCCQRGALLVVEAPLGGIRWRRVLFPVRIPGLWSSCLSVYAPRPSLGALYCHVVYYVHLQQYDGSVLAH